MALKLNKEHENTGVMVTYWKVAMDEVNIYSSFSYSDQQPPTYSLVGLGGIGTTDPKIGVIIYGYLDEDARRSGKEPIEAIQVEIPCPTTGNFADERRPLIYYEIKQLPGWELSEDVLELS